jgi:hypothetical protein
MRSKSEPEKRAKRQARKQASRMPRVEPVVRRGFGVSSLWIAPARDCFVVCEAHEYDRGAGKCLRGDRPPRGGGLSERKSSDRECLLFFARECLQTMLAPQMSATFLTKTPAPLIPTDPAESSYPFLSRIQ